MESKVAVVTGASRGIGKGIAIELANAGWRVACVATSKGNAQGTVDAIGENAAAYGCDIGNSTQISEVFAQIASDMGPVTALVNNAGITRDNLALRMKEEDWNDVVRVNLGGAFFCSQAVMKGMMKARFGRIVNISSVIGLHGQAGQSNYAAAKAGLIGLTLALAKELGSRNITVNAVAPGFIDTDMTSELGEEFTTGAIANTPLSRLGTVEDVARVVRFLCSDDAGFITGQTVTVDGGLFL